MAKPRPEDVRFFLERSEADIVAAGVLGLRGATREAAARGLAELAADRARLGEVLAALPGAAVLALEVIARTGYPLQRRDAVRLLEGELGAGRGEDAFRALHGRGFLATGPHGGFEVWRPLVKPILEVLEGVDLVAAPDTAPGVAAPDRGTLAIALLLGELLRRRPRITMDGSLYKRDSTDLDGVFAGTLGPGGAELFVTAFSRMGLAGYELTPLSGRSGARIVVDGTATAAFLARPRRARVEAFARAHVLPPWLGLAFRAGDRVAPREALSRAERTERAFGAGEGLDRWLGYCLAAGILEEIGPGLRAAPEVRGEDGPARPGSGRWLVQPNLELIVPPDVPPVDAFRLACVAEVAALDRAAVLRLTPASLARAADAGLDVEAVTALLSVRSAAPLPDLVVRAVHDGARGTPVARAYDGVVVTVPPAVLPALRARRDLDSLVQAELAPGVFLLHEGAEARFGRAIAAGGGELRASGEQRRFSADRSLDGFAAKHLERLLARPPVAPPDARLAAARVRARAGDPAEFAPAEQPIRSTSPEVTEGEVEALLDALFARIERCNGRVPLGALPPEARRRFVDMLDRVADGRVSPLRLGPEFVAALRTLSSATPLPPGPVRAVPPAAPAAAPALSPAWQEAAAVAIAEKRDLWLELAGDGRPRLVTPHRVVQRGGAPVLEALAHDSGDLRAFDGERIRAAGPAGPSERARLPGDAAGPVLRAARNGRCPCGSGRKYKACCLPRDLAGAAGG